MGSELIYDYLNEKISYEHFVSRKEEVINALHDSGALIYADVVKRSYEQKAIALIQTMPISVGNQDYLIDSLLKIIIGVIMMAEMIKYLQKTKRLFQK